MILLPEKTLSIRAQNWLKRYRQAVADSGNYAAQVEFAAQKFRTANTPTNKTFSEIRRLLLEMSSGAERCHYCEDSKADEVEHFAPKNWYPEKCFDWNNYCIACGPCNGPKNAQFAVFRVEDNTYSEFPQRDKDTPIEPPPIGRPVLINPRFEDPLQFLFLDIEQGTFFVTEWAEEGTNEFERAKYTIKVLGLNSRSYLPKARGNAYANYRARLVEYLVERDRNPESPRLKEMTQNILTEQHPTVWAEMKRQWRRLPDVSGLFEQVQQEIYQGVL